MAEDARSDDDVAAGEDGPVDEGSPRREPDKISGINPRTIALSAGAILLLVIVLSQILGGGGDNDEPLADSTPTSVEELGGDPLGLFTPSDERPAINPLRGCDLLSDEVLFAGLGSDERGIDDMGNSKRGSGESCTAWLVPEDEYFVAIEPGDPSDFVPGTALGGVVGEPVDDVSDSAIWFGGDPAFLSVHTITEVGDLVFRVLVGRPDLSEDGQRDAASAAARAVLPLFPAVEVEQPEAVEIVFDTEEPPTAAETFHGLLVAGEESGKWTRGGGLVEGLRFLLGEPSQFELPSDGHLFTGSATGLLLMAIDYAENGADESAQEEIKALLSNYSAPVWTPPAEASSTGEPEAVNVSAAPRSPGDAAPHMVRVAHVSAQEAQTDDTEDPASLCLYEDRSVYGPAEPTCQPNCWWQYRAVATDPFCLEEINTIRLYYPQSLVEGSPIEGPWNGWDRADLEGIRAGIIAAGSVYALDGRIDNIIVHISNFDKGVGVLLPVVTGSDECHIYLTKPLQDLSSDMQAFRVAIDLAGCLIDNQLPHTVFDEAGLYLWWYRGLALYFAAEALPESDLEWSVIDEFQAFELSSSLQTRLRDSSNWTFFRHVVREAGGSFGAFNLVAPLSDAPTVQAQQDKLAAQPGVEELLHTFHEALSDGVLGDRTDRLYHPQFGTVLLNTYTRIKQPIIRFGVKRYHVTVPAGRYACFEDRSGIVKFSWRAGAPGPSLDGYDRGMPKNLTGDATIVVTTVYEDQSFDALVRLYREPGCDEDKDDDEAGDFPELCDFCDPSLYFRSPGSVAGAASQPPDRGDPDEPPLDAGDEGGGGGDGGSEPPPPGAGDDVGVWLAGLCPVYDEWLDRIAITDDVDPTTLDLDERIERAERITGALVDAADDLLGELDDLDAPQAYMAYQERIASRVAAVSDDMQRYLDDEIENLSDLEDAGLERQFGLELIVSEARRELNDLSAGDRELFDTTADLLPECVLLPR